MTNALQSLTEKGLIERRECLKNNVMFIDYRATYPLGKNFPRGREKSSPHNIDDNYLCMSGTDKTINEEIDNGNIWELVECSGPSYPIQCLKAFNDVTGWDMPNMPPKATECLNLRSNRYTVEDVAGMIKMKRSDWMGTKMEKFLKPSTLFSPDHFDEYMEEYKHQNDEREFSDDEIPY